MRLIMLRIALQKTRRASRAHVITTYLQGHFVEKYQDYVRMYCRIGWSGFALHFYHESKRCRKPNRMRLTQFGLHVLLYTREWKSLSSRLWLPTLSDHRRTLVTWVNFLLPLHNAFRWALGASILMQNREQTFCCTDKLFFNFQQNNQIQVLLTFRFRCFSPFVLYSWTVLCIFHSIFSLSHCLPQEKNRIYN